jgi:hypothetical protein
VGLDGATFGADEAEVNPKNCHEKCYTPDHAACDCAFVDGR